MTNTVAPAPWTSTRLDVYSLRLFVSTVREGSIARASEKEHIAASALSRRLAGLEHVLGVPLLVRSARGITLTEAGQCVFEQGNRIEQNLHELAQSVWAASGQVVGTVRLSANASAIVGYLPERLRAYSEAYPAVDIVLQELRSWEVLRACLDDRADIGLAVAMDVPKGMDAWHFSTDPLIVLLPLGHSLAKRKRLRFDDVAACGLVGLQPGGALDQLIRDQAREARTPIRMKVSVNSFDATCRMVEAGLGVAIVPKSAVAAYAGSGRFVRAVLDEKWAHRELKLYAPRKSPRSRAVELLITALTTP